MRPRDRDPVSQLPQLPQLPKAEPDASLAPGSSVAEGDHNAPIAPAQQGPLQRLKRRVTPLMLFLAAVFVGFAAWRLVERWESTPVTLSLGWLIPALLALAAGAIAQAFGWIALLDRLTRRRVDRRVALRLYFDSQLARYLPGKIGLPVVRMAGAAELGSSKRVVGVSVLVEVIAWCAVGAAAGLLALVAARGQLGWLSDVAGGVVTLLLGLCCGALVALVLIDRRRFPFRLAERLAIGEEGPIVPPALSGWMLLHWLGWGLHGLALSACLGLGLADAAAAAGYFMLAPVAGFLALAAPAGVGVREAVIGIGLEPLLAAAPALVAALLSRGCSLTVDVLMWLGARALTSPRVRF